MTAMSRTLTQLTAPPDIGAPAVRPRAAWVQTERQAHEAWGRLIARRPRAAMLLHMLVAQMGQQNAVVISQKTLGKLIGLHERTVRRAIEDLVSERWIQVVRLNGPGTVAGYVVNSSVAWGQPRDQLHLSSFSAVVVADAEDQDSDTLCRADLRQIPVLYPGERQLPAGPGETPPSQPAFGGLEPDLPVLEGDAAERAQVEAQGQQRLFGTL